MTVTSDNNTDAMMSPSLQKLILEDERDPDADKNHRGTGVSRSSSSSSNNDNKSFSTNATESMTEGSNNEHISPTPCTNSARRHSARARLLGDSGSSRASSSSGSATRTISNLLNADTFGMAPPSPTKSGSPSRDFNTPVSGFGGRRKLSDKIMGRLSVFEASSGMLSTSPRGSGSVGMKAAAVAAMTDINFRLNPDGDDEEIDIDIPLNDEDPSNYGKKPSRPSGSASSRNSMKGNKQRISNRAAAIIEQFNNSAAGLLDDVGSWKNSPLPNGDTKISRSRSTSPFETPKSQKQLLSKKEIQELLFATDESGNKIKKNKMLVEQYTRSPGVVMSGGQASKPKISPSSVAAAIRGHDSAPVLLTPKDVRALIRKSSFNRSGITSDMVVTFEHMIENTKEMPREVKAKESVVSRWHKAQKLRQRVEQPTRAASNYQKKKKDEKKKKKNIKRINESKSTITAETSSSDSKKKDRSTFPAYEKVRCVPKYDFTNFVPPSRTNPDDQPKTKEQYDLIENIVKDSVVFQEFRSKGKARNDATLDILVDAFEPITLDELIASEEERVRRKEDATSTVFGGKNDMEGSVEEEPYFYIVEQGEVDFQVNGVTVGKAKAGEAFGEEALLNYDRLTVVKPSDDSVHSTRSLPEDSDDDSDALAAAVPTRLLRLDSHSFRGILQTQVKQTDEMKRQIIEGIDFLKPLFELEEEEENDGESTDESTRTIKTHRHLIRTMASLLVREELEEGDILDGIRPDEIFHVVQSGNLVVTKQNDDKHILTTLEQNGDYYGERAILGNLPKRKRRYRRDTSNESLEGDAKDNRVRMHVTSEEAVVYTLKRTALRGALGRARLEKLHDLLIFGETDLFQKVATASKKAGGNRSSLAATTHMEHLAQKIEQKTFLPGEGQDLLKDEKPDLPAIYVVQEGSALVTYTSEEGGKVEKTVQAGEVFGDTQIQQDNTSNTDKPKFRRREGFKAITSGEEPVSVGILPLQEIQNAQEEAAVQSDNNDYDDLEYTNDLGSFQLRNKVRTAIQADIRFEDLEKVSVLGEGQFGEVWLVAVDVFKTGVDALKQRFALKTQHKNDEIRGDQADDAIRLEIEAMNALNHPNIVNLVNTYEDETSIYLLMGLIPGGELWNYVHKEDDDGNFNSGIPESEAKFYTMVLADTLAFIHHRNYVFRDLKPENIMLDEDGYPVIVDFGFAKHIPDEDNGKTYTFCGTPNYAAPEIITNSGHGKPVDYWALGITIYEMITGENPFFYDGMEQMALYDAICEEDYYKYSDDKSSALTDLTNRLLEKDPALRLGTLAGGVTDIMQHEWFEELELSRLRSRIQKAPWKPQVDEEEDLDDEAVEEIMAGLNNNHVELVRESEPKSSEGALKISLPFDDSMKFEEIEEHESSGSLQFGNDSDYLEETVPLSQESEKSFFESHQLENSLMFEIQEGENEDAVSTDNESLHIEDDEDQDSLVETVLLSKESNISPNVENHRDENSLRIENIVEGENEDVLSADESLGVEDDNDFAKESTKLSEEGTTAEMMQNQSDSYSGGTDQSEISGKDERSSFQSVADDDYSGKPAMFFSNKTKSRFDSNSVTATPKKRQSYLNGQVLRHHHSAGAGRRKKLFGKIDIQKKERRSTILGSLEGLGLDDSEIGNDSFWGLDGEK